MYAVIETGGKQYRVEKGDVIDVELIEGAEKKVTFDRVLLVGGAGEAKVGSPTVDGATVQASLVDEVRGPKVIVYKKKRRKGYERTNGHRQDMLRVRIDKIQA